MTTKTLARASGLTLVTISEEKCEYQLQCTPFTIRYDGRKWSGHKEVVQAFTLGFLSWPKRLINLTYSDSTRVLLGQEVNPTRMIAPLDNRRILVDAACKGSIISGTLMHEIVRPDEDLDPEHDPGRHSDRRHGLRRLQADAPGAGRGRVHGFLSGTALGFNHAGHAPGHGAALLLIFDHSRGGPRRGT